MPKKRNYKAEYEAYHGKPEQVERRAGRNKSRAKAVKAGLASKGDGRDVHHKDHNPKNHSSKNIKVISRKLNRGKLRTK